MEKKSILLGLLSVLVVVWLWARWNHHEVPIHFNTAAEARAYLNAQVEAGNMTTIEAQARLAEILAQIQKPKKGDADQKISAEQKAFGETLKKAVSDGEMSAEEAKAKWSKSFKESGKGKKGDDQKK